MTGCDGLLFFGVCLFSFYVACYGIRRMMCSFVGCIWQYACFTKKVFS